MSFDLDVEWTRCGLTGIISVGQFHAIRQNGEAMPELIDDDASFLVTQRSYFHLPAGGRGLWSVDYERTV